MLSWVGKLLKVMASKRDADGKLGKGWYQSKTLWVNALALVTLILSDKFGVMITGEETTAILAVVNMVLRLVTNGPVGFKDI